MTAVAARTLATTYSPGRRRTALIVLLILLVAAIALSLAVGSRPVNLGTVWGALTGQDVPAADRAAVVGLRLPRTVLGLLVGAGLAVAGGLMQAVTRNPLADPGILGVTSGAAFAVAMGVVLLGVTRPSGYVWFAFAGALAATLAVYLIGSAGRSNASPVQLTLAGVAISAVLTGIVGALRLADQERFAVLLTWESGSFQARGWSVIVPVLPFVLIGLLLAGLVAGALNTLGLGEDLATALGASVTRTRVLAIVAITLLAGGATAMAGPITLVGLMVPHIVRWLVGPDQRWILGLSAVAGPVLVLLADVAARVLLWPGELPVGVVTAFVGAPVLIGLVRRRKASGL
ncbi:FecCD family ABC transporter permease [Cellulomonas denverensis]|uniref:FecCD family ABC transporter permease n=1 Tax=Cellulomonas denverensis TaxID=264297 RepID=UPI001A551378|nr:iron chelate uptake ABC transporter family permease subunit [Cellulomonas denverensis]GIG25069.1 ABC transporter permease [Cellulomonas denverensis]